MKRIPHFLTITTLVWVLYSSYSFAQGQNLKLWYNKPADASVMDDPNGWKDDPEWLKSLPLGNGSLGLMVFGDVNRERLQLNEESMWSGSPDDNDNPNAYAEQTKIRELLFEGKYKEATELTNRTQVCKGAGSGHANGAEISLYRQRNHTLERDGFHEEITGSDGYSQQDNRL